VSLLTSSADSGSCLVFVTVGTDCHPFLRLMEWIDVSLEGLDGRVRCLVQHGVSPPPRKPETVDYMTYSEIKEALEAAAVVVSHGGPGTIMMTLAAGKVPIVVPRRADIGEHVDNHQVAFARRVAAMQTICLAEEYDQFLETLTAAVEDPHRVQRAGRELGGAPAVAAFANVVDRVVFKARASRVAV
jgi:UDP-N-acetylglucosamine transferase subunit ALG13